MIDAETTRIMENWQRWRCGAPIGIAISGAYDLEAKGRREETSVPLINGEASDVDEAVHQLEKHHHQAVVEYWLKSEPVPVKALRCGVSVRTLYRHLDRAHALIRAHLDARRARTRRAREALSRGQGEPFPA